eukprot:Nk52_evm1s1978 gene=Nk52_evmTU1s1978
MTVLKLVRHPNIHGCTKCLVVGVRALNTTHFPHHHLFLGVDPEDMSLRQKVKEKYFAASDNNSATEMAFEDTPHSKSDAYCKLCRDGEEDEAMSGVKTEQCSFEPLEYFSPYLSLINDIMHILQNLMKRMLVVIKGDKDTVASRKFEKEMLRCPSVWDVNAAQVQGREERAKGKKKRRKVDTGMGGGRQAAERGQAAFVLRTAEQNIVDFRQTERGTIPLGFVESQKPMFSRATSTLKAHDAIGFAHPRTKYDINLNLRRRWRVLCSTSMVPLPLTSLTSLMGSLVTGSLTSTSMMEPIKTEAMKMVN